MRALITGIAGQDGSYLAEFLLEKGYEVFGLLHRGLPEECDRIANIVCSLRLLRGDLMDQTSLETALRLIQPDEVYNLAALSSVAASWSEPVLTADVNGIGVLRILEAVRKHAPKAKFFQASSSEMFGRSSSRLQDEQSPLHPCSPYGIAKLFGHAVTVTYRESYGLFACSGICFNHESPRRGIEFVTRKVTQNAARIKLGLAQKVQLGNLDVRRDWGFARDYISAMWMMMQRAVPEDFVIATGETHSVRQLLDIAFGSVGLQWQNHIEVTSDLFRPGEVSYLCGDSTKARQALGWTPTMKFRDIIEMMVESDMKKAQQDLASGFAHIRDP